MSYKYDENENVEFTVRGETVRGTVVGRGDAVDETYTVQIQNGNLPPGRYEDQEILVEEGVAFVPESHLN